MSRSWNAIDRLKSDIGEILEGLQQEVGGDVVTALLYDPGAGKFCLPIARGLRDTPTFEDRRLLPRSDRVAGKIIRSREPMIVREVRGDPDMDGPFARRERIESVAGFPILDGGEAIGVLFVSCREPHDFTKTELRKIERGALAVSKASRRTPYLEAIRELPDHAGDEMERTLDAIVQLGCALLGKPISLWLLERSERVLRIRAGTGLIRDYMDSAVVHLDDGSSTSVVQEVMKTGKTVEVRDLAGEDRFGFLPFAEEAGWTSLLAVPIELRGQPRGVLEIFTFSAEKLDEINRGSLGYLTTMTSVTLENAYRTEESKELARIAQELSKKPEFEHAMALIVSSARRLTGADSSTIILHDKRTDSFIVGFRDPAEGSPTIPPRKKDGLTRQIIESDVAVRMNDVRRGPRANPDLATEGFLSSVGVRLQMEEERIGVLYVDGRRVGQFTKHEEGLLRTLADHASMALGWEQMLVRSSRAIEQATSDLYRLEARLDELCTDIKALGFDFAAVSLVRPEENTIETVHGTGIAEAWSGRSSHYLQQDRELRDIQADLVLLRPLRTEIIRGWDDRFDRGVFVDFEHLQLVRIFMPLFITRDRSGEIVTDWIGDHSWEPWKESHTQPREHREAGDRKVLRLSWPPNDYHIEVIGTVETGFRDPQKEIPTDLANELSRLVAGRAKNIRRSSLHHILEAIVEQARQIVGADSATLHFPYEPEPTQRFLFQAQAGRLGPRFLSDFPPRERGLGWEAMKSKEPRFIPDPSQDHPEDELGRRNPEIYRQGIKAMAAVPLVVGSDTGVLYAHFQKAPLFREAEIGWIRILANRAADAIRHVMNYTKIRDRARQLATLQSIAHSLGSSPDDPDLLRKISGNTLNIFAADVVTIYEYNEREDRVLTPPSIAGRLKEETKMRAQIYPDDAPRRLIRHDDNVYAPENVVGHEILNNSGRKISGRTESFVTRERIRSAAAIILRTGTERVGVMFINYRRPHRFSEEEKDIIHALASSAAVAIQNRRDLERRQQDLVTMTHQLQAPLASLIGHLSAVDAASLSADDRDYLENAQALAEDSLSMCHGTCMAFARAAGREMSFLESSIDPPAELEKLCHRLQVTNDRDDLRFSFRVGKGPRTVWLDREVFTSVMYSLVHNAMKYSDRGSTVKVEYSFKKRTGTSMIKIATIGEPIPPEDRELVFERFRRSRTVERTGRHHKGVGIGLWVARELMLAVGGDLKLHLSNKNPRYSQFVVHLPATEISDPAAPTPATPRPGGGE